MALRHWPPGVARRAQPGPFLFGIFFFRASERKSARDFLIKRNKLMITYQTDGVPMPTIDRRKTTQWIKAVAQTYGKRVGDIAYIFCSDERILEVNRQYLQHDYYTLRLLRGQPPERRPLHQPRHRAHQRRAVCRGRLRARAAPRHHTRHPAPVWLGRQGAGRTRADGAGRRPRPGHAGQCLTAGVVCVVV